VTLKTGAITAENYIKIDSNIGFKILIILQTTNIRTVEYIVVY